MPDIILEDLARRVELSVMGQLPAMLTAIETEMAAKDADFYGQLNQQVPTTPLPPPVEYYTGHQPGLLERDLDLFPNVTVFCYDVRESGSVEETDQFEVASYTAYLELFCIDPDEDRINRMALRYAKGLHRAVTADPTLGGVVLKLQSIPTTLVSMPTARRVSSVSDEIVYVQGVRLEYELEVADVWR